MSARAYRATVFGVLTAFLFSLLVLPMPASAEEVDLEGAGAVWFYHLESERLMVSENETERRPAGASLKLLSGLIACERLSGQLGEPVEITEEMIQGSSGYRFRMEAGEVYTVEQLLYLALCGSYNDAYDVLAYLIGGGSVQSFVALMNARAAELGAVQTMATDPTGIADSSLTSAEDLAKLARVAIENPLYLQISGSEVYDLGDVRIYNRNSLVSKASDTRYYNSRCRGMTAGATKNGGASVVTLAEQGNDRYLCIVLGAVEEEGEGGQIYSYVIANRLIQWGYDSYTYLEVLSPKTQLCTLPVKGSDMTDEVEVAPAESLSLYLPADISVGEEITYSIRLMYEELEAPVTVGMHVGYVAVVWNGEICGTLPLYTTGEAERGSVVSGLLQIRSLTESRRVRAGGIFFLVTLVGWILTEYILLLRRRHKWDKYFSAKIDLPETILTQKRDNHRPRR